MRVGLVGVIGSVLDMLEDREYMSFEEAIYFMRKNKITSQTKFRDFFRKK